MEIEHLWTDINGQRVHALHAGTGDRAVMLLHGGGMDSAELSWGLLIPELAQTMRVYAPDWPGYGQSDMPDKPFLLHDCALLLRDLMERWGIPRAALVGISLGGGIALDFTLANPGMVERLVLVDSYGLQRKAPMHALSYLFVHTPGMIELTWASMKSRAMTRWALKSLFHNHDRITPEIEEQLYAEVKKPGAGRAFAAIQKHDIAWDGVRTCFMDQLHQIQVPALIIHGGKDGLVPLDCSRQAHERISGSRLHIIPNCGHWPQRDCPDEFNRAVVEFLSSQ